VNKINSKKNKSKIIFSDKMVLTQLFALIITVITYGIFLSIQRFLFSFEKFRNKIIAVNILLTSGLLIYIGHFIWEIKKKNIKETDKLKKENSEKLKTKKEIEND